MTGAQVSVDVGGRTVRLTHLDRVLWPRVGWTKADLVRYVADNADVLVAHVRGHPQTLRRFPEGVGGPSFFQTRAPSHPPWVRAVTLTTPTKGKVVDLVVLDDEASLVWAANLATLELHPFLGTADDFDRPAAVVFDLDPGAPADLVTCCRVALELREVLADLGLRSWPKVSGAKGLHVHVPTDGTAGYDVTRPFAEAVAGLLAQRLADLVITTMAKRGRPGRVFVDWMQNHPWKSTVAPYSLRGFALPTVAAPVTWDEVERAADTGDGRPLVVLAWDVPARLERFGDLMADALTTRQALPSAVTGAAEDVTRRRSP